MEVNIKKAQEEFDKDQLLKAIEILKLAEDQLLSGECEFIDKSKEIEDDAYSYFINLPFVKETYKDNDFIYHLLDNYKKMTKRDPDRSHDGIDTWFMNEEKVNSITISGRVTIACPFFHMLAVFKEIDLLQKTISSFEELKVIKEITKTRWLARARIKMPLTVSNREVYILGYGIFLTHENMVMIPIYTPDDNQFTKELIPEKSDYTRIDMKFGYYCVKYIDETHCELFSCFNVDPKVSMIPWFVLNGFIKEFGYYFMRDFRKAAEDEKLIDLYKERIEKNKDFYNLIRNSLGIK